jgi:hypothetical protein
LIPAIEAGFIQSLFTALFVVLINAALVVLTLYQGKHAKFYGTRPICEPSLPHVNIAKEALLVDATAAMVLQEYF